MSKDKTKNSAPASADTTHGKEDQTKTKRPPFIMLDGAGVPTEGQLSGKQGWERAPEGFRKLIKEGLKEANYLAPAIGFRPIQTDFCLLRRWVEHKLVAKLMQTPEGETKVQAYLALFDQLTTCGKLVNEQSKLKAFHGLPEKVQNYLLHSSDVPGILEAYGRTDLKKEPNGKLEQSQLVTLPVCLLNPASLYGWLDGARVWQEPSVSAEGVKTEGVWRQIVRKKGGLDGSETKVVSVASVALTGSEEDWK